MEIRQLSAISLSRAKRLTSAMEMFWQKMFYTALPQEVVLVFQPDKIRQSPTTALPHFKAQQDLFHSPQAVALVFRAQPSLTLMLVLHKIFLKILLSEQ